MYSNSARPKGKRKAFGKLSGNRPIVRATDSLPTKKNLKSILKSPKQNEDHDTTTPRANTASKLKQKIANGKKVAPKDDVTPLVNNTTKNKRKGLKREQQQSDPSSPRGKSLIQEVSQTVTALDDCSVATHDLEDKVENLLEDAVAHGAMDESDHDMNLSSGDEEQSSCASHVTRSTTRSAMAEEAQSTCFSAVSEITYSVAASEQPKEPALPPGWIVRYSRSKNGKPYFCNHRQGIKTWNHPARLASSNVESKEETDNTFALGVSQNECSSNSLGTRDRDVDSNTSKSAGSEVSYSSASDESLRFSSTHKEVLSGEEYDDDISTKRQKKSLSRLNTTERSQSPWAVYLKTKTAEKGRNEARKKDRILLAPICSLQSLDILEQKLDLRKKRNKKRKSRPL